ncbi:MAG: hypothetical protein P8L42_09680 [Flavicella sp.]|nr:hypothetical protein [Flavicella sp.]
MKKNYTKAVFTGLLLLAFITNMNAQEYKRNAKDNRYTSPAAIEPITGYLPSFSPVMEGGMKDSFYARYELVRHYGQTFGAKSKNKKQSNEKGVSINEISGSLKLQVFEDKFSATEMRNAKDELHGIVKLKLNNKAESLLVENWEMESFVKGVPETRFIENGSWENDLLIVKSKNTKKKQHTENRLIANWSLLSILSSGKLRTSDAFVFDMLENSICFPNQRIMYEGVIEVPISGGTMKLDSYAQIGWGRVPTHYLVDSDGRVQLITGETVSWALKELINS